MLNTENRAVTIEVLIVKKKDYSVKALKKVFFK